MITYPKYELSPGWCPLHQQIGPCMYCLSPEVAVLVETYNKKSMNNGILFQKVDENIN